MIEGSQILINQDRIVQISNIKILSKRKLKSMLKLE